MHLRSSQAEFVTTISDEGWQFRDIRTDAVNQEIGFLAITTASDQWHGDDENKRPPYAGLPVS